VPGLNHVQGIIELRLDDMVRDQAISQMGIVAQSVRQEGRIMRRLR
jgi:hypothetical protein